MPCRVGTIVVVALEPTLAGDVLIRDRMASFQHLLDKAVTDQDTPDPCCLDLYREFDVDTLTALAGATTITQTDLGGRKC